MKAAIFHSPKKVSTEEVKQPAIKSKDILIKVKACCICGSDLHMYKLGMHSEMICRSSEKGLIPGHEFSGEIVSVGNEVTDLAVGDRVAAYTNGGMAEYVPVIMAQHGHNVFRIPDGVTYREAATLEPLANSMHAVLKGNPAKGENVVVFGAGIIGLGIVQVLKTLDFGLNKIIVVDVSDKRLEMAEQLGADAVINISRDDLYSQINDLVESVELPAIEGMLFPAVDIVYDCVGYIQDRPEPPVLEQAIMIARPGSGRIVTHGIFEAPLTLDFSILVGKQIRIIGSFGMDPGDSIECMALLQKKRVDRKILISHEFSLDQVHEAFETSCAVKDSIKVLIRP